MKRGSVLAALMVLAMQGHAAAEDGYTVGDMVECRVGQSEFGMMVMAIAADPNAAADYGLAPVASSNPLLAEFVTSEPITAFGMQTSRIAFASSGILGMFEGVTATELANRLDIEPVMSSGDKFLGEKVVFDQADADTDLGMRFRTRIALNVSTVDTHPGIVLAGCTYAVTTEDMP